MATPDREPPIPPTEPRRPFYYPAGWGCLFWLAVVLILYVIIGLLWAPLWAWYPWWW